MDNINNSYYGYIVKRAGIVQNILDSMGDSYVDLEQAERLRKNPKVDPKDFKYFNRETGRYSSAPSVMTQHRSDVDGRYRIPKGADPKKIYLYD